MRTVRTFALCLAVMMSLLCMSLGAAQPTPASSDADLVRRIAALEAKVAELEKKAASPPLVFVTQTPLNVPGIRVVPETLDLPAGSQAYQFNGSTYYVTPLAH
jgi:hypothetical protein